MRGDLGGAVAIQRVTGHLFHLINGTVDLSKLEAGRFKLNEDEVEFLAIIQSSLIFIQAQAQSAKMRLRSIPDKDLPLQRVDERPLLQVRHDGEDHPAMGAHAGKVRPSASV
jgi:signal transduction histidine kinase